MNAKETQVNGNANRVRTIY